MDERPPSGAEPRPVPPERDGAATPAQAEAEAGIVDAARLLLREGNAAAQSTLATLQALKALAGAELALARTAISRALLLAIGAGLTALVAVFYLFATLSALLVTLGLGWAAALGISTLLLVLIAGGLSWRALTLSKMARFDGTRRQLTRLREGAP
jgi:hypothetical protein